ncbi:uncharacterized protein [Diabrotica undecimpunctata]|uniref:uncharacterized protein n=1 Tax=Diabrotica undecimpunctata TaxID=50387 RepID=UPI003B63363F
MEMDGVAFGDDADGGTKLSVQQKEIMVAFLEDHPDFAKGKLLGHDGKGRKKAMWEILSTQLNGVNGPKKNSQKWQRVWIDLKNKVKKKASAIKNSMTQTGGGPPLKGILSDLELKIISIIGDEAIYGLNSSRNDPLDSEDVNQPPGTVVIDSDDQEASLSSSTMTAVISDSEPDVFEDHNYTLTPENPRKRRLLSSGSSSSYNEVSPRATKSRKVQPAKSAAQAATKFVEIGEVLNQRMESIDSKLEQLIQEKKETNSILRNIVTAIENLRK